MNHRTGPFMNELWLIVLQSTHDCLTNTPDPRLLRLVCKNFLSLVDALPDLWHHIIFQGPRPNILGTRFRLERASTVPLRLCLENAPEDDAEAFTSMFREHQSQWKTIEIHGCNLSILESMFTGTILSSLESLRLNPRPDTDDEEPSPGTGLSVINTVRLRFLFAHIRHLHFLSLTALVRMHLDCQLPPGNPALPLAPALVSLNLTHLHLSGITEAITLLPEKKLMPSLATFILTSMNASMVRPLLASIDAPLLHTLAITLATYTTLSNPQYQDHSSPLCGYPALQLVHLNQDSLQRYNQVPVKLLFSLGWAFPRVSTLQTNLSWAAIAHTLDPTPADWQFTGKPPHPFPIPFPQLDTLALRCPTASSMDALEQLFSSRAQSPHPISCCGIESHLLHTVRLPLGTRGIAWDRDFDSKGAALFPIL
ncbi:hypothetical protein HWV62_39784 [Athelia sp. TMB]|nr:hypothetical protein HWV62_39784 [Athelia sp. TMB]